MNTDDTLTLDVVDAYELDNLTVDELTYIAHIAFIEL